VHMVHYEGGRPATTDSEWHRGLPLGLARPRCGVQRSRWLRSPEWAGATAGLYFSEPEYPGIGGAAPGRRVLGYPKGTSSVSLRTREAKEDWLELGCDLVGGRLPAPRLVAADGAPGLISKVKEIWPRADRQHCAVHRVTNLQPSCPVRPGPFKWWSALRDATSRSGPPGAACRPAGMPVSTQRNKSSRAAFIASPRRVG
jgi:hypothetical protein